MMDTLNGRTAVITGAASGLGRAMAERMAAEGMRLVLADIEAEPLDDLGVRLGDGGTEVVTQRTDVSQAGDIDRLAALAFERFGAVHVLCNNAGVVKRARSWELTEDDWRWVLDVDLWSVIHAVRAFVPRMLEQSEGGHIVNTASMSGLLPIPNLAAYSVAKAAVVALSEALQLDLDAEGASIGVSVLCPGFIATRITESERNRPAERTESAAVPAVAPHHGRCPADHGRRRGRRPGRRRDQDEPLLDPDPPGLPIGDPATRCRRGDGRPPDGATDLVTGRTAAVRSPRAVTRRAPSGRSRRSGTTRS